MSVTPATIATRALYAKRADPLAHFRFSSDAQRQLFSLCAEAEVYWRAGNSSGKTLGGAALGVALARGVREVDGAALPKLRVPNVGWLVVPAYKMSTDSVIQAYMQMIGTHPHHVVRGSQGSVIALYVKPDGARSDSHEDWSKIVVHVDRGEDPVGGRIDWAHADEPPSERVWREVRFRFRAGAPFIRFITATPLERKYWEWLKNDFAGSQGRVVAGKIEIVSSMRDNRALPLESVLRAEQDAENDPYKAARLRGDYVDASGLCPWAADVLDDWMTRTRRGLLEKVTVTDEVDRADGRNRLSVSRVVEFWEAPHPEGVYLVTTDASSGVKSVEHDPAGIHVWERRTRALVARFGQIPGLEDPWNGYVGAYGLGWIAADLARRYSAGGVPALVAPEGNAWSGPTLTALKDAGHTRILHDRPVTHPGQESARLGFVNTQATRPLFVGAIEQALERRDVTIPSPEVIQCLKDCVIDAKGKIVAGPGYHDEDLILAGAALHIIGERKVPAPPAPKTPDEEFAEFVKKEFGVTVPVRRPGYERVPEDLWS